MPFLLLLLSCAASTPEPVYTLYSVPVATEYAQASSMRRFVAKGHSQLSEEEVVNHRETYCQKSPAERAQLDPEYLRRGVFGYAVLEVAPQGVYLSGQPVLSFDNGQYAGEMSGLEIPRLQQALTQLATAQKEWARGCSDESFTGELLVVIDPSMSYLHAHSVVYNVFLSQFTSVSFLVAGTTVDSNPVNRSDGQRVSVVLQESANVRILSADELGVSKEPTLDTSIAGLKETFAGGAQSLGCSVVIPDPQARWSDLASLLGVLHQMGSVQNVWASGVEVGSTLPKTESTVQPEASDSFDQTIAWDAAISVLPYAALGVLPPCRDSGEQRVTGCNAECTENLIPAAESTPLSAAFGTGIPSGEGQGSSTLEAVPNGTQPSSPQPRPKVRLQKITLKDGQCADKVTKTARKYSSMVRSCYSNALANNVDLSGRVVLEAEIVGGKVVSAKMLENDTEDGKLGECILGRVKRWKFPSGCSDVATIPLVLTVE